MAFIIMAAALTHSHSRLAFASYYIADNLIFGFVR